MNNLMKLFSTSVATPFKILSILVAWIDLINRASDTGIQALDVELNQVQSALDVRTQALDEAKEALAAARKARSSKSVADRVSSIEADYQ